MQMLSHAKQKNDPALKYYSGISLMINNNDDIKQQRGYGRKCIGLSIKSKKIVMWIIQIGMED